MENIIFKNEAEERRFQTMLLDDDYQNILLIWGVDYLFSILKWYQYISNDKGTCLVISCIEDHLDQQFRELLSE